MKSKGASNRDLVRTLNAYSGTKAELLKELEKKYLQTHGGFSPPPYKGNPNPEINKEIHLYDLREAIADSKRDSAPGPDQIADKLIANLDDHTMKILLRQFNSFWMKGKFPEQ